MPEVLRFPAQNNETLFLLISAHFIDTDRFDNVYASFPNRFITEINHYVLLLPFGAPKTAVDLMLQCINNTLSHMVMQ